MKSLLTTKFRASPLALFFNRLTRLRYVQGICVSKDPKNSNNNWFMGILIIFWYLFHLPIKYFSICYFVIFGVLKHADRYILVMYLRITYFTLSGRDQDKVNEKLTAVKIENSPWATCVQVSWKRPKGKYYTYLSLSL